MPFSCLTYELEGGIIERTLNVLKTSESGNLSSSDLLILQTRLWRVDPRTHQFGVQTHVNALDILPKLCL